MFASPAFAQSAAGAAAQQPPFLVQILPMLAIGFIFYLLLFRPQQKRMKQHREMIAAVKRNDVVVTGGGLVGKVVNVTEDEVEVELAPNVRVRAVKGTLSDVRQAGTKAAND